MTETVTEPPEMTLRDVCPEVESLLPEEFAYQSVAQFARDLDRIYLTSDLETKNAIEVLRPSVGTFATVLASRQTGLPYNDAERDFADSIGAFANRCRAAGSSALS